MKVLLIILIKLKIKSIGVFKGLKKLRRRLKKGIIQMENWRIIDIIKSEWLLIYENEMKISDNWKKSQYLPE